MNAVTERIPSQVFSDHDRIAAHLAARIAELIRARAADGRAAVLGLATGSTPLGIYRELIRLHREEGLDLSGVVTFNLDEYHPMDPTSPHSYHRYMWENFFPSLSGTRLIKRLKRKSGHSHSGMRQCATPGHGVASGGAGGELETREHAISAE